jgi:hypothetical protein
LAPVRTEGEAARQAGTARDVLAAGANRDPRDDRAGRVRRRRHRSRARPDRCRRAPGPVRSRAERGDIRDRARARALAIKPRVGPRHGPRRHHRPARQFGDGRRPCRRSHTLPTRGNAQHEPFRTRHGLRSARRLALRGSERTRRRAGHDRGRDRPPAESSRSRRWTASKASSSGPSISPRRSGFPATPRIPTNSHDARSRAEIRVLAPFTPRQRGAERRSSLLTDRVALAPLICGVSADQRGGHPDAPGQALLDDRVRPMQRPDHRAAGGGPCPDRSS